jgi:tetratricopeptide (TPR) repeat protein
MANATRNPSVVERTLKWVGSITAVLTLVFAVQKLLQGQAESSARDREIGELMQIAARQQQSGDYALAAESLQSAAKLTESGGTVARLFGSLDAASAKLRVARQDLSMAWLDDMTVPQGQTFAGMVEPLLPILEQGVLTAEPARRADLLAHIGWGYFLRSRDGKRLDPLAQYQQAVAADALNPYAHVYWGHWLLWNGGAFTDADAHFKQALQADRTRPLVRRLQLSAYGNRGQDGEVGYVAIVADMLRNQEPIEERSRRLALWNIQRACYSAN